MIFLAIVKLNIWPDFYDSVCDCYYNFFCCVFLPRCAYQNFLFKEHLLGLWLQQCLSVSPQSLVFGSPCVLDSSQPLSISPEPLIQCQELPHSSYSGNTTFHSAPSNFSRMPLGCLPARLALIGYLQQQHSALPYFVSNLLFLVSCLLG